MQNYIITFQPVMDGIERKCIVKDTVPGYKHDESALKGLHYFGRGNIDYVVDARNKEVKFWKYNYKIEENIPVTCEEFTKFIDIVKLQDNTNITIETLDNMTIEGNLITHSELDEIAKLGCKGLTYLMNVTDKNRNLSYMWFKDDDTNTSYFVTI